MSTGLKVRAPVKPHMTGKFSSASLGSAVAPRGRTSMFVALTRRRSHCTPSVWKESVASPANGVTLLRLVVTLSVLGVAIALPSPWLLALGLVVSWLFDTIDGYVARRWRCETVFGAQFDAGVDRVTALLVVVGSVVLAGGAPGMIAAAAVAWLHYGVVDQLLFAQFLRFGLWTPDEFHQVDERVWLVSWSQAAKLVNGTPTATLAIGGSLVYAGALLALLLIATRVVCYVQIAHRCGLRVHAIR